MGVQTNELVLIDPSLPEPEPKPEPELEPEPEPEPGPEPDPASEDGACGTGVSALLAGGGFFTVDTAKLGTVRQSYHGVSVTVAQISICYYTAVRVVREPLLTVRCTGGG
jgi:hypothetical protein